MNVLLSILAYLLRSLLPALLQWWAQARTPTAEVSAPNPARQGFRDAVLNSRWGMNEAGR